MYGVEILAPWKGFSIPSGPVASLVGSIAAIGYAVVPAGRARRMWFALGTVPLHWLYYAYCGVSVVLGLVAVFWARPSMSDPPVTA